MSSPSLDAAVPADRSVKLPSLTVGQLLGRAAAAAPDRIALKQCGAVPGIPDRSWTYRALHTDSRRMAAFLLTRFNRGEHIALWGANSAEWLLYQLAAAQAGLVLVTLNPALRGRDVAYPIGHSKAAGLIMDRQHRDTDLTEILQNLRPELADLRDVLFTSDWADHMNATAARLPDDVRPDDPAMVLYTSGTTGKPKGVVLSHRGIVANAALGSLRYNLPDGLVWLNTLPYFHVGGSVTASLGCIARASTHIVLPSFEAGLILKLLEQEEVAWLPVVPTMVLAMLDHADFPTTDLSRLKILLTGGAVITPEFLRLARRSFSADLQVMFGQTEAGGGMTKTFRDDPAEKVIGTVGKPYPHTAIKIARLSDRSVAGHDEVGEICVNSPCTMLRYLDNQAATAAAFDDDGYLRTGDLGAIDPDGYLRVTGRLKEMIIRGGENIYPREVEDALAECPGVAEVAVIGVPDAKWGEELAAVVRPVTGCSCDAEAMVAFLRARIARHKVPKLWRVVDEFPRTASGKIQKFALIAWFTNVA